jgi:outer membrane receptor protein involved in Fe transport
MQSKHASKGMGALDRRTALYVSASLGALACLTSGAAWAQAATESGTTVGDVVVTATRRGDTHVIDTPLAVHAVGGDTLTKYSVVSLQDLNKVDPSIDIQNYGAGEEKIVIRGIESPIGSTTGIYLDEVPLIGGLGGNIQGDGKPGLRLHDVDHVEVLKGPQGTLFGASSMSGTLRVIPNAPDLNRWGGTADASYGAVNGGDGLDQESVTLNAPILKGTVAIRGSYWRESGGGYIDQTLSTGRTLSNVNDERVAGGRVSALWAVTPDFHLTAMALRQTVDVAGTQGWQLPLGPYLNHSPSLEIYDDSYDLYSLKGEYRTPVGVITANYGYTDQYKNDPHDSTPTAKGFGLTAVTSLWPTVNYQNDTYELRFSSTIPGPVQFVAGVYYQVDRSQYQTNAVTVNAATGIPACVSLTDCNNQGLRKAGRGMSNYEFGTLNYQNTQQTAYYAQADYKVIENVTATVGIRYYTANIQTKTLNLQTVYPDYIFGILTPTTVTDQRSGTNSAPSYNFALMWKPNTDTSFYVRAASGFRIGGLNTITSLAIQYGVTFPSTYAPDHLWDYEGGVKKYFFNHKMYMDASVYYIDWTGQQLSATAPGAFAYTINAGRTNTYGAELDLTANPIEGLTLGGDLTYTNATLGSDLPADVVRAGTPGVKGDRIPLTAEWAGALRADYERPIANIVRGYVQGDLTYRGSSASQFEPADLFYTKLPAYTLVDLKAGVRIKDYDVGVFVHNAGNSAAFLGLSAATDGTRVYSPPPRTVGVQLLAKF